MGDDEGVTGSGTPEDPYVLPEQVITGDTGSGVTGSGTPEDPYVLPEQVITADDEGGG